MRLISRAAPAANSAPYVVQPSKQFDGNDGSWSTFRISVGTPGQDFRVLPSTKGGVTYVVGSGGCVEGVDPTDCPKLRGIDVFNSAQNTGFQVNASSTWSSIGDYNIDLEQSLGYAAGGLFGFDKVSLGAAADSQSSLSLDRQVVASMDELSYFLGVLPLGQAESSFSSTSQPIDSLLYQLRNTSRIPSLSYSYTAGAKYRLKSVFGSLTLGGYDSTRFKPNTGSFSFSFSADPSKLLTVSVASILATNTLQGQFSLTSGAHFSVIDSTVPHLWLPTAICTQFENAFGLTYDSKTDLYLVNDTIHEQLKSKNPTITIKLVNGADSTSTNYTNIQLPYAAFDLQASYPYYQNSTNYFPIRRAANSTQYVLGRTLLQEAYLIVDYERANFTVAQAVFPDPLPAAKIITITSGSQSSSKNSSSSSLSGGAIAGIVIGAILFLALLIIAFLFLRRRRRRRTTTQKRYELAATQAPTSTHNLTSTSLHSTHANGTTPYKSLVPQELSGTPLTELPSPLSPPNYPRDQKSAISVNETPQELHGESRTPVSPRWEEVLVPPRPRGEGDASSGGSVSGVLSEEGSGRVSGGRSGVSPLSGQWGR